MSAASATVLAPFAPIGRYCCCLSPLAAQEVALTLLGFVFCFPPVPSLQQSPSRVESVGNGTSSRGPGGATSACCAALTAVRPATHPLLPSLRAYSGQMGGPPSYRPSLDILSVCVRDQMQHLEIFKTFNSSKSLFVRTCHLPITL